MNLRGVVVSLGLFSALGAGCVVDLVRGPYEGCPNGESCSASTVCLPASYALTPGTGRLCSVQCTLGEQCPPSIYGNPLAPTCVVSASTGQGLCYDTCTSNLDCGIGTRCAWIPNTSARVCVPLGGGAAAPTCGGLGQPCCSGSACSVGLACNTGVCGGSMPNRTPYQKCDVAAGDVCGGGTACIPSIAQAMGKARGSSCTRGCSTGAATSCPGYMPGATRQSVECVNFTGNLSEAQCFRLCETQNDCVDYNTTCTAFMMPTGQIRVCVPAGPRGG